MKGKNILWKLTKRLVSEKLYKTNLLSVLKSLRIVENLEIWQFVTLREGYQWFAAQISQQKNFGERLIQKGFSAVRVGVYDGSREWPLEYNIFVFWNPGIIRPANYDCIDFCK